MLRLVDADSLKVYLYILALHLRVAVTLISENRANSRKLISCIPLYFMLYNEYTNSGYTPIYPTCLAPCFLTWGIFYLKLIHSMSSVKNHDVSEGNKTVFIQEPVGLRNEKGDW